MTPAGLPDLERAGRQLALVIPDDDLGTDYETMLRTDLGSMTPKAFAAEWKVEPPMR